MFVVIHTIHLERATEIDPCRGDDPRRQSHFGGQTADEKPSAAIGSAFHFGFDDGSANRVRPSQRDASVWNRLVPWGDDEAQDEEAELRA